uniref:CPSF_A domain-containing protein n=1 Tax=Angiostrongylus cantonensis TaxID=6313 RepID=A0A0K0DQJ8_ANGCA
MHTALSQFYLIIYVCVASTVFTIVYAHAMKNIGMKLGKEEGLAILSDFDLIAIGFRDTISIYNERFITDQHSGTGPVVSIPLLKPVSGRGFIEFKFMSKSQLFYCDSSHCRKMMPDQVAIDPPYISDFSTVEGFSRGKHTYFVGSAFQPYEPFINANIENENRTVAKITSKNEFVEKRILLKEEAVVEMQEVEIWICNFDTTPELESRMDVAIECGLDDVNQRVEVSSYDPNRDQITIVVASTTSFPLKRAVCVFSMAEVEERFERDWRLCQKWTLRERAVVCVFDAISCISFLRVISQQFSVGLCHRKAQTYRIVKRLQVKRNWMTTVTFLLEERMLFECKLVLALGSVDTDLDQIVSLIPDQRHGAYFIAGYAKGSTIILRVTLKYCGLLFSNTLILRCFGEEELFRLRVSRSV